MSGSNYSRFVMEVDANSCHKMVHNAQEGQVCTFIIPPGGGNVYVIKEPSWEFAPNTTSSSTTTPNSPTIKAT